MPTAAPTVEVVVFTYNHQDFVERALASVLAQDFDIPFTIRIHDDASTDATVAVIHRVLADSDVSWELVQAPTNRYSTGTSFYHEFIAASRADYVAVLDGDDFWVDNAKVGDQVRLLERTPTAALCHHPVFELVAGEIRAVDWPPAAFRAESTPGSALSAQNVISSSSVLLRTSMFPRRMPAGYNELGIGDYPMWALATTGHDIAFIDRAMTAYRVHATNIFASQPLSTRLDRELEARIYISNNVAEVFRPAWRKGIIDAIIYHHDVTELREAQAELLARTEQLAAARQETLSLLASTSWRITFPLRAVVGVFHRRAS